MNAEIIAIGDEIIGGQLLDTNSQWLSLRLEELGFRVSYHSTIGDALAPSVEAFRRAAARADVVVVTGGLGPTADDLTREAMAEAFDRPLRLDAGALEDIRQMFVRRNRPMSPRNELQAMIPAGGRIVRNPRGTAPGIDLDVPREGRTPARVICLPGVPAEMVAMWRDSVAAPLGAFGGVRRVLRRRQIRCFGAGESQIEAMLPDLIRRGRRPTVGITAGKTAITLRIAADGATEEECFAAMTPTVAVIRQCLGTLVFGEGDDELQHVVVRRLRERGKTLAAVEICTAGLVAEHLGGVEGSADVFRGGLVVADLETAAAILAIPRLDDRAASVELLAIACRERFGADYGLAVGPLSEIGPADEESPVLALASAEGVRRENIPPPWHRDAEWSRVHRAQCAINYIRLAMS